MKKYIGVKMIEAESESRRIGGYQQETEQGYKVVYPDGYVSWSPKKVFEEAYLPVSINKNLKTDAPSVSQQMVDDFIASTEAVTMGDKCTVVRAVLRNGFEIVESSACVSAENYDEAMGAEICMEEIKDKVWFLLGFLLACGVNGIKGEE